MSSAYKGYWLNGSKENGYTAEAFKGPRVGQFLLAPTGKVLTAPMADIKRAIVKQPAN